MSTSEEEQRLPRKRDVYDRIPEVGYLDTANTRRYRAIMRYFYERKQRHHNDVSLQEILRHLQGLFTGYGDKECRQDLDYLVKCRNLDEDYEKTVDHARSVADVRHGNMFYMITPVGIRAEEFAQSVERLGKQFGELDGSALGRIRDLAAGVGQALSLPLTQADRPQRVRAAWEDLWMRFDAMARAASDYMSNMKRQEQEYLLNLDAFFVYKHALVRYLTEFVEGLQAHSDSIWHDTLLWNTDEMVATIADATKEGVRWQEDRANLEREYRENIQAFCDWFSPDSDGAGRLREYAGRAIVQVTRASYRLAETESGTVSRGQDLLLLAERFSRAADLREAERLAQIAFGLHPSRHWQLENGSHSEDPGQHAWRAAPVETVLQKRQSHRVKPSVSAADLAAEEESERLLRERHREMQRHVAATADKLFAGGVLQLGNLASCTPEERQFLLECVNGCVTGGRSTQIADGSTVQITYEDVREHVWIASSDGDILLPDYRLERITAQDGAEGAGGSHGQAIA